MPADALWGIHALRAQENFPISAHTVGDYPHRGVALAEVKQAAVRANVAIGILDPRVDQAIDHWNPMTGRCPLAR